MSETSFAVVTLIILGWAAFSNVLLRLNLTGPLVLTVAGFVLANPDWGLLTVDVDTPSVHHLAEATLALLLFADAARVDAVRLRRDVGLPFRLLLIGLPLTLVLGGLLAALVFDDLPVALACFVAATLAPTDAALSAQIINDEGIPRRLRRALNVESGLNDGFVTPIVVATLAVAASQLGLPGAGDAPEGQAVKDLALGLTVGLVVGLVSGRLNVQASRRGWMVQGVRPLVSLAAAAGSFTVAVSLDGNGFIAAFVAGIAFGAQLKREVDGVAVDPEADGADGAVELPELIGEVLALFVWFLFGAALVPVAVDHLDMATVAYALLSLTVLRMLPVALALVGAGLDRRTVLFVGWFGPRGLASVVFALLAIEELGEAPAVGQAISAVCLTVLLSVVLHGATAGPLGRRYAEVERDEEGVRGPRGRRTVHTGG